MITRSALVCVVGGVISAWLYLRFEGQILFAVLKPASSTELRLAEVASGLLAGLVLALPVALVAKPVKAAGSIAYTLAFLVSLFSISFISYWQLGVPRADLAARALTPLLFPDCWTALTMSFVIFQLLGSK